MSNIETTISINDKFSADMLAMSKSMNKMAKAMAIMSGHTKKQNKATSLLGKAYQTLISPIVKANKAIDTHTKKLSGQYEERVKSQRSLDILKGKYNVLSASIARYTLRLRLDGKTTDEINKKMEVHKAKLAGIGFQRKQANMSVVSYNRLIEKAKKSDLQWLAVKKRSLKLTEKRIKKRLNLVTLNRKIDKSLNKLRDSTKRYVRIQGRLGQVLVKLTRYSINLTKTGLPKFFVKLSKAAGKIAKSGVGKSFKLLSKGLSLIGQKLIGVNEGFGRLAKGGMKQFQQAVSDVGRGIATQLTRGLKTLAVSSVKTFADLELSMKRIAIFGGFNIDDETAEGRENLSKLDSEIKRLTINSLFNMEQVSAAFENVAAIGDFTDKGATGVAEVTDAIIAMATATGETDLEKTSEILMTTMNAFGDAAGSAAQVASILTKVANDSALTVSQIGDAMQYVAPTAATAGISIEQASAAIAVLSNMGFQASRAGTSLNQAMQKMIKPTTAARATMNALGISFFDQAGEMKNMTAIVPEVAKALQGLETREERLAAMTEMFGIRGGRAMSALVANFDETSDAAGKFDLSHMVEELETLEEGYAELQMVDMMDTAAGAMARLQGSIEALKATFGEVLGPSIELVADALSALTQDPAFQEFLGLLASTLGDVLVQLIPIISALAEAFLPVLEMLTPIISMLAGFILQLFEPMSNGASIIDMIVQALTMFIEVAMAILPVLFQFFMVIMDALLPVILQLVDVVITYLLPIFMEFMELLMPIIAQLMPLFKKLMGVIVNLMPIVAWLIKIFIKFVFVLMAALMPVIETLIDIIVENQDVIENLIGIVGMLIGILILLMPIIQLLGWLLGIAVKILMFLLKIVIWVAKILIQGLFWAVFAVVSIFKFWIDALIWILELIGVAPDGLKKFSAGLKKTTDGVKDMVKGLDDMGESAEESDGSMTDLGFAIGDTDDIGDDLEEEAEGYNYLERNVIPIYDDDAAENLSIPIDTDSLNDATEEVGEFVLSGTSIQDLFDLSTLTGITPTAATIQPSTTNTNTNTTTFTVDKIEIILENPEDILDSEEFINRITEGVLEQLEP